MPVKFIGLLRIFARKRPRLQVNELGFGMMTIYTNLYSTLVQYTVYRAKKAVPTMLPGCLWWY
jgi:hypothetical protein